MTKRLDRLALGAGGLAFGMLAAYVAAMVSQRDTPVLWAVSLLAFGGAMAVGTALSGSARMNRAGVLSLAVVGVLGAASVGLPVLLAVVLLGLTRSRADTTRSCR